MKNITKDIFLNTLACPTLGWLLRHEQATTESSNADRLRALEGEEIGRRARLQRAPGVHVETPDMTHAVEATARAMADPKVKIIYEAAFRVGPYATRADILVRGRKGWTLVEVKSATSDKPEQAEDVAYTLMVMRRAGVKVVRTELMLLDKHYRLGMSDNDLFAVQDKTADVFDRADRFDGLWDEVERQTGSLTMPSAELAHDCKGCVERERCVTKGLANPLFDLPRLSRSRFDGLIAQGIREVQDIPAGKALTLTTPQRRVWRAVTEGRPVVSRDLPRELSKVVWPAYYLDFETMGTAIPLYPDTAPWEPVLTQYSLHILSAPGGVPEHREYLADPARDCRRELAARLLADLGDRGSIVVYSSFEQARIKELAARFPDLHPGLEQATTRIYDLERVIRAHYYHPGFHGRTSIKKTLPVLVPGMSYDKLAIGDGDSASATFALMAMGRKLGTAVPTLRHRLLEYCGQDTLAMVKLHQALLHITAAP